MLGRDSVTRLFLWVSVLASGIVVGALLFDLRVLAGAWSASPPESLSLLPYGPRFPVDTGEFFIPISAALLVASFGALISGWQTPPRFRVLLLVPPVLIVGSLVFTVTWFWPHNRALWHVAIGAPDAIRDRAEIIRMAHQWVTFDWLRVTMGTLGFVCVVRASSLPFPAPNPDALPATRIMKVLYATGIAAVLLFVTYFLVVGLSSPPRGEDEEAEPLSRPRPEFPTCAAR